MSTYNPLDILSPLQMSGVCGGSGCGEQSDPHNNGCDSVENSGVIVNVNATNSCGDSGSCGSEGNGCNDNGEDPVNGTPLLQASGSASQDLDSEGPILIVIDTEDLSKGELTLEDNKAVIPEDGDYFYVIAPQVGWPRRGNGGDDEENGDNGNGNGGPTETFRCWAAVDGQNVDNSNVQMTLKKGDQDVIVSQGIIPLSAGDKVGAYCAVSDDGAGLKLEAIDNEGEPLVPSVIFTIYKL